jgi:small subunit ribosomal protein S6
VKEYETVFILHPQVDEAGIEKEIEAVKQTIETAAGEVTGVYKWGRRKLAYPIRKTGDGFYTLIRFKAGPEVLRELDRRFKLNESVLRHLTVHSYGEPTAPEQRSRDRRGDRGRFRRGGRGPVGDGEAEAGASRPPEKPAAAAPAPAVAPPAAEAPAAEAAPAPEKTPDSEASV